MLFLKVYKIFFNCRLSLVILAMGLAASFSPLSAYGTDDNLSSRSDIRPNYLGTAPYLSELIGVPELIYRQKILPGAIQRALAIQALTQSIYDPESQAVLLRKHPVWKMILEKNPGYWPELVGHIPDHQFARMGGSDIWLVENKNLGSDASPLDRYEARVGEENGANVGGSEFLDEVPRRILADPKNGDVPFDTDGVQRLVNGLLEAAERHWAESEIPAPAEPLIVIADEASNDDLPRRVEDGSTVLPPYAAGKDFIDTTRAAYKKAGITWISLVEDRGLIRAEDDQLYLYSADGLSKRKIDIFMSAFDMESADPLHSPQLKRNEDSNRHEYNQNAKLVGIPGLIKAWKQGGFFWANNPTSLLARSKFWPIVIDEYIRDVTGQEAILPYQKTITLFDSETGALNEESLQFILKYHKKLVFKEPQGGGGKQVHIGDEMSPEKLKYYEDLARSPGGAFKVIAQPRAELGKVGVTNFKNQIEERFFDLRMLMFYFGNSVENFKVIPRRNLLARTSVEPIINVSRGGAIAIAIPTDLNRVQIAPKIPFIGANQTLLPHAISSEEEGRLLKAARDDAAVEAEFYRELRTDTEKLFREVPGLEARVKSSWFYRTEPYSKKFPVVTMYGPDYYQFIADPSQNNLETDFGNLERNPTNVGGLIRMLQGNTPGIHETLHHFFWRLRAILKKTDASMGSFGVYLIEDSQLARPGETKYDSKFVHELEELKSWFRNEFKMELITSKEIPNFSISDGKLYYQSGETKNRVALMVNNIEPDFLDPTALSDEKLLEIMPHSELEERRMFAIPGIDQVMRSDQLFVVNGPGQDITGPKNLIPYWPILHERYLAKPTGVSSPQSRSFANDNGELIPEFLSEVFSHPEQYYVKNSEVTGGGGGVASLQKLNASEKEKLLSEIMAHPVHYIAQRRVTPLTNLLGYRTELRGISFAITDHNTKEEPEVITIPNLYGRAADINNSHANLVPTGSSQIPGFASPIRVKPELCRIAIAHLLAPTHP